MNTPSEDYHALLARHDAMRLRRRILTPEGSSGEAGRPAAPQTYDGTADQRLVEEYLPLVGPLEELIADLYQVLFDRHPYLRSLFPESMAFQQAHLAVAFRYLIGNLHRTDVVAERFTQLGRDHRKLGVRPAHFAAFEGALVEALRARAGVRWTGPLEDAWLRMLRLAVSSMVRGENDAIAELSSWEATVTAHELRTPDLAVLRVRPQQPYPFRAGQYASLETPLVEQAWRPYYLARAPHRDGELEFHVRARRAGGVSEALVRGTRVGGTLRLGAPRGLLTLPGEAADCDVLLIASGTGWAPMKALLQEVDTVASPRTRVRLLLEVGAGDEPGAGMYDTAHLEAFRRGRPWLTVLPTHSAVHAAGGALRVLNGVLPPHPGASVPPHVFLALCPEAAAAEPARTVTAALAAAGVPEDRVHQDASGVVAVTEASASTTRSGSLSA
ncbi:globin domain-containing protein [Streptomyces salyersiae]|uniref:nitric oxide dioxygenase n=1 Tax=Streptomyces salyersiae TaxID=3075530 RepID=A0ABU2RME1_9ACTN|nr:globin domain-containing protein [Streptomyces sp. DSM 41770]MDT0429660.1 globin domain-containing protein [Streptomyces sp. DSM 41770]